MSDRLTAPWAPSLAIGAVSGFAALSSASLVAALASVDAPLPAVATRVINFAPTSVKHWAIETFGTHDKLVLGIGIAVILWLAASLMARWSRRTPTVVPVGVVVFAVVGIVSVRQRGPAGYMGVIIGALVAWASFAWLGKVLDQAAATEEEPVDGDGEVTLPAITPMPLRRWDAPVNRRQFVARATALSVAGATFGITAAGVTHTRDAQIRNAARKLPTIPAGSPDAAATIGPDATVDSRVTPFLTPADRFYKIDTTFVSPRVTLDSWRLKIHGQVDHPLELSFDDLLDRHIVERVVTLCCVSNEVGGDLIGNARWMGVPLAELLHEVGPHDSATQIAMTSVDGWTCGFPTKIALDGRDALVVVGMNGEPLPIDHGFPVRVVVPGLYGYVSATKWVTDMELTTLDAFDGYWIPRGWSKDGPVKTQSRIDVPGSGDQLDAGRHAIAGIAWAQHRGIATVEVRVDDRPWATARLSHDVSDDAWRQWVYDWDATKGHHRISVRATDGTGATQTSDLAPVEPDGATGWHTIDVDVP